MLGIVLFLKTKGAHLPYVDAWSNMIMVERNMLPFTSDYTPNPDVILVIYVPPTILYSPAPPIPGWGCLTCDV